LPRNLYLYDQGVCTINLPIALVEKILTMTGQTFQTEYPSYEKTI
jgi:hypothetical protein